MAKKKEVTSFQNTVFNVKPIHISRIKAYLDAGFNPVIIHGDGSMFVSFEKADGTKVNGKDGSDHHVEFNSGVAEINKDEKISRAKFRAIYNKGDELPETPTDVVKEFYNNQAREMQNQTIQEMSHGFENTVTLPEPVKNEKKQDENP